MPRPIRAKSVKTLSSPALVSIYRTLLKKGVVWKLTSNGRPWLDEYMFKAVEAELENRNITIDHPEKQK